MKDNYDLFEQYERQKAQDEAMQEKISEIEEALGDIITLCDDYDTEGNADLCNRLEQIREKAEKMASKL